MEFGGEVPGAAGGGKSCEATRASWKGAADSVGAGRMRRRGRVEASYAGGLSAG